MYVNQHSLLFSVQCASHIIERSSADNAVALRCWASDMHMNMCRHMYSGGEKISHVLAIPTGVVSNT